MGGKIIGVQNMDCYNLVLWGISSEKISRDICYLTFKLVCLCYFRITLVVCKIMDVKNMVPWPEKHHIIPPIILPTKLIRIYFIQGQAPVTNRDSSSLHQLADKLPK